MLRTLCSWAVQSPYSEDKVVVGESEAGLCSLRIVKKASEDKVLFERVVGWGLNKLTQLENLPFHVIPDC